MNYLLSTCIVCVVLLANSINANASFQEEDQMSKTSNQKTTNCRQRYVPQAYIFVGNDSKRELALYRKVNEESFYQRLKNVMPRILRLVITKK